jgi:hypothetical protein
MVMTKFQKAVASHHPAELQALQPQVLRLQALRLLALQELWAVHYRDQ